MLGLLWIVFVGASFPPLQQEGDDLPDASGVERVRDVCTLCHSLKLLTQQRLSRSVWEEVVDDMMEYGAPLSAQDHHDIVDYLSINFGPEDTAYTHSPIP